MKYRIIVQEEREEIIDEIPTPRTYLVVTNEIASDDSYMISSMLHVIANRFAEKTERERGITQLRDIQIQTRDSQ